MVSRRNLTNVKRILSMDVEQKGKTKERAMNIFLMVIQEVNRMKIEKLALLVVLIALMVVYKII